MIHADIRMNFPDIRTRAAGIRMNRVDIRTSLTDIRIYHADIRTNLTDTHINRADIRRIGSDIRLSQRCAHQRNVFLAQVRYESRACTATLVISQPNRDFHARGVCELIWPDCFQSSCSSSSLSST